MKKASIILILYIAIISYSCENEECKDCICNTSEPLKNTDWLNFALNTRSVLCTDVYYFTYLSREYIGISDCQEVPDGMTVIYDCAGKTRYEMGGGNPGSSGLITDMPLGFSYKYYFEHRVLIYHYEPDSLK